MNGTIYISMNIDLRRVKMGDYQRQAAVFRAFCDENRLRILEMLRCGEMCACKLLENLDIGQSTLSHHMKILCDAGVVVSRADGKWTHYRISEEGAARAADLLKIYTAVHSDPSAGACCGN